MNPFHAFGRILVKEQDRWLLWAPVGMGVGIAGYFTLPFEPLLWALLATPVLIAATWLTRHWLWLFIPAVTLLALALGFNASQLDTKFSYTPMLDREIGPVKVTGQLIYTEVMPEGVRLTLKYPVIEHIAPEKTPIKLRIKFNNKSLADVPPPGSWLSLWAQVGPFSEPVMPGANDFRWQGYFKQLGGLGWSYSHIDTTPPLRDDSLHDKLSLLFERGRMALAQHVYQRLSGDVAAMTATRLNGEQTAISKPVIDAMRVAGLAHLLSTSGFHVTIMGLLIYFPLRALLALIPFVALRYPIKKWAAFGAILSTGAYTLLVGSQAATLRSMLMTLIAMLAIIADRRAGAMRLVVLSAALAMLLAPDAMLGPSFQMSFAAVFCLIATHERTFDWMLNADDTALLPGWLGKGLRHFGSIITTSLVATAATTPFAIYHFQTVSFYGFIANMLAIPLTSFWVMPNILLAYLTAPLNWDGPFISAAGGGIWLTIKIATYVASWPYSIFYLPAMPVAALVLIVFGGLWLFLWRQNWRWLGLLPILIGAGYALYTPKLDLMIAPDGTEWAARLKDGRLAVSNLDKDAFAVEQWQQRLGNPPTVDVSDLRADDPAIRCDEFGCVYRHAAHIIALPTVESAALEDCTQADIVITPFLIHNCAAKTVLDEPQFWYHGAQAVTFDGDTMRITHSRERRGERPWSPGWRQQPKAAESDE